MHVLLGPSSFSYIVFQKSIMPILCMLPNSIYHPTMFQMLTYFGSQIQPEEGEEDDEHLKKIL